MSGLTTLGSSRLSGAENRVFRYEVTGLRQTYQNDQLSYPIRNSGSFFLTIPYGRLNEELRRINRLGGKIVSVQPITLEGDSQAKTQAVTANQNLEAEGKSTATEAQQTTESKGDGDAASE